MAHFLLLRNVTENTQSQGLLLALLHGGHAVTWDRSDAFHKYRDRAFDAVFLPSTEQTAPTIAVLRRVPMTIVIQRNHILHTLAEIVQSGFYEGAGSRRVMIWAIDPLQARLLARRFPDMDLFYHPLPFSGRLSLALTDGETYRAESFRVKGRLADAMTRQSRSVRPADAGKFVFLGAPPAPDVAVHYSQLGVHRRLTPESCRLPSRLLAAMRAAADWAPGDPIAAVDETACLQAALQDLALADPPDRLDAMRLVVYAGYLRHLLLLRRKRQIDVLLAADRTGRFVVLGAGWPGTGNQPGGGLVRNRTQLYGSAGCIVDLGSTYFSAGWYNRPFEVAQFGNALLRVDRAAGPDGDPLRARGLHGFGSVEAFVARLDDLPALQANWAALTRQLWSDPAVGPPANGARLLQLIDIHAT